MSSTGEWCLIESDPGVFTELIRGFGVTGAQVEELFALDPSCWENLKPIHGLIFLFKWVKDSDSSGKLVTDPGLLDNLFFAKQVIPNACATQALVNILLNLHHPDVVLGPTLSDFKLFTECFDSDMKGLSLSNADLIRQVHNSFARQQMFEFDQSMNKKDKEDVFHFISYIPFAGRLLELDGLKTGPYDLGPVKEGEDWVAVARPHIEKRMAQYAAGEIHFNLMALVSDRKMIYERRLKEALAASNQSEVMQLTSLIEAEDDKALAHKNENIRRKHNYLPLIIEILTALGKDGKLLDVYNKAKQKAIEKEKKNKKEKKQKT